MGEERGRGPALPLHHVHADPDTALRVLHRVQRDTVTVDRVDTQAPVADALHQPEPGRHGPVHVVPAGPRLRPQQPAARGLPRAPDEQLHEPVPRGAEAGRHRHHRRPSDHVGLQPLHRHPAAAPLSGDRHARHRHRVRVLPVDPTARVSVRLFPHDTLPGVPIAEVPVIRVICVIFFVRLLARLT